MLIVMMKHLGICLCNLGLMSGMNSKMNFKIKENIMCNLTCDDNLRLWNAVALQAMSVRFNFFPVLWSMGLDYNVIIEELEVQD